MSKENVHRRDFLKGSLLASAGVAWGAKREEAILLRRLAQRTETPAEEEVQPAESKMPKGTIGGLEVSRLICGGNLIGGWAHARDLL